MSLADALAGEQDRATTGGPALTVDAHPEGGEFTGLTTTQPIAPADYENAFAKVYTLAGLDPAEYRIVDDTVRFSAWEQSARAANGDRDKIQLYSYRARFQRITGVDRRTEEVVAALAANLRSRRLTTRRTPGTGLGPACTFAPLFSDWQFGKNAVRPQDLEHGTTGVEQTAWRIERAVDASRARIKNLRRVGRNITGVAIGHMGDPTENVYDSYENQSFIVELNLVQQMEIALDRMVWAAEELLPLGETQDVFAVLCNHGQLSRRGTKTNVTDDSDNVQNHLMRLMRDRIVGPKLPRATWHIPGEEMITTLRLSGVDVAAAHGHKIRGDEGAWLLKQTTVLQATRGVAPRVWLTAHRHSQDTLDLGAVHRIQAATADGGSKYFTDGSAIYATPGTTTLLIGEHDERGFSDVELL